jgi:hypothetical protein
MPLKTAAADRLVVCAAFLVVLLAASLVAAIPIYADAVAESSLRARLERTPATDANLQLTVDVFGNTDIAALDTRVQERVHETFRATRVTVHRSAESGPFRLGRRTVVFGFLDGLPEHATLLAGRWPADGASRVEIALPGAIASTLELHVGDAFAARSRVDESKVVDARVVGIYEASEPSSAFWWGDPLSTVALGPLVASPRAFRALGLGDRTLRWRLEPDTVDLTIGAASALRRELSSLPQRLNEGRPAGSQFDVQTGLPAVLGDAEHSLHLARAGVLVPFIQLALLAIYGLIVTTALLLERRFGVTETLRLRGGTALQITTMALVEATVIAVPAVALAPWLAAGSMHALNHVGPLADVDVHLEPRVSAVSYALAAGAGVVCVLGLALPALRARRVSVARERRRPALAGLVQRARLDLVVACLALLGYWQLRRYHGTLVSHEGSLGIDPFLVAAPAVLLLAGALLSLRAVPLVARLVERRTPGTQGTVSALGFRQLARRPRAYSRSVLLLVLAVAIGVFATTYASTWHRSQVEQARYSAGADVRVEPSGIPESPPTVDLASSYAWLGAIEALPVASDSFSIGSGGSETASLLALDARRAARVVHVRNDFASRSLPKLLAPLAGKRGALASVPLPGRPSRLAVTLGLQLERGGPRERPSLYLYLRDAEGLVHVYRLPGVPGREQRREIELVHRLPDGSLARPSYPLSVVGLELDVAPMFVSDRRVTVTVRSLETASDASGPWRRVALGAGWRGSAVGFDFAYLAPRIVHVSSVGDALEVEAMTGSTTTRPPRFGFGNERSIAQIVLRPGADTLPDAMPVVASDAFLDAVNASVGDELPLALSAGTRRVEIVGSFHRFPTLPPETPAVVADLESYIATAFAADRSAVQPGAWWLAAPDDRRVADRLRSAPFRSITVVSRTEEERALLDDPVAVGVIGALALGFVVAAIFAVAGFAANAAAEARSRKLELAVLRSLGLRRTELTRLVGLETALVVGASLVVGAALGLVVSRLVLPDVGLGASGATPVPPVRLVVPWTSLLLLVAILLVALAAIGAVQVELVRRLRLAPTLRGGEGVPTP